MSSTKDCTFKCDILQKNIDVALSSSIPLKEINEALEIQTAEDKPIDYWIALEQPNE